MIDSQAALPGDVSYLAFLAPGLLAAAAMQVATFESTYPVLGKMAWHRNYEAIIDYNCSHSYALAAALLSDLMPE